jgi:hypothetical protein
VSKVPTRRELAWVAAGSFISGAVLAARYFRDGSLVGLQAGL